MKHIQIVFLYLVFSFLAADLIILLVGLTPSHSLSLSFSEKIGVASVFILCCSVGISQTFRPNWIRQVLPKQKKEEKKIPSSEKRPFHGHHPECPVFQNHTIRWNKKIWCAGCLGLFIGLCGAILFMILYIGIDFRLTKTMSVLFILLGLLILAIVFGETFYQSQSVLLHVFINSLLPLSFFLLTIAVGEMTGQFVYGFFAVLLCFLWLDTRIQLSKWRHSLLCSMCSESCKMFPVSF